MHYTEMCLDSLVVNNPAVVVSVIELWNLCAYFVLVRTIVDCYLRLLLIRRL